MTASLTALWLRTNLLPLNVAALSAAGACLLIALAGSLPITTIQPDTSAATRNSKRLLPTTSVRWRKVIAILIGAVIAGFLFLIPLNNVYRDIFPWVAFTTWMYRAKVWALSNGVEPFSSTQHWLESGSAHYVLEAAHYPISVSAIAAFSAALAGGWSDQGASLPWFFTALASCLVLLGLSKYQAPQGGRRVACGMLATTPLLHLHEPGRLRRYLGDGHQWHGFDGLCIWSQRQDRELLAASFLLLGLGCQGS